MGQKWHVLVNGKKIWMERERMLEFRAKQKGGKAHTFSDEDIINNPGLRQQGIKSGDQSAKEEVNTEDRPYVLKETVKKTEKVSDNTQDALRRQLDDMKVKYHHKAGVSKLQILLEESKKNLSEKE